MFYSVFKTPPALYSNECVEAYHTLKDFVTKSWNTNDDGIGNN